MKNNKARFISHVALLATLLILILLAFRVPATPQGGQVANVLGLNQLPHCPAAVVGTTFVYYSTVTSTAPLRTFTGCAALGPGLSLSNNGSGMVQITAPNAVPMSFTYGEVPAGTIDGTNAAFTLKNAPNPAGSLEVFRNIGVQIAGVDYTLSGNVITFTTAPQAGDLLMTIYRTQ